MLEILPPYPKGWVRLSVSLDPGWSEEAGATNSPKVKVFLQVS